MPVCTSAHMIKADDFELGSICPHENSLNPVLPSLGACSCNTEALLIRIRDISYDQRNSISRTSPRLTKWSFANPLQLLIAAANITGHKWLHPETQIWLIKHRLRLSVLFTLVFLWHKHAFMEMQSFCGNTQQWFMPKWFMENGAAYRQIQPTIQSCFFN